MIEGTILGRKRWKTIVILILTCLGLATLYTLTKRAITPRKTCASLMFVLDEEATASVYELGKWGKDELLREVLKGEVPSYFDEVPKPYDFESLDIVTEIVFEGEGARISIRHQSKKEIERLIFEIGQAFQNRRAPQVTYASFEFSPEPFWAFPGKLLADMLINSAILTVVVLLLVYLIIWRGRSGREAPSNGANDSNRPHPGDPW